MSFCRSGESVNLREWGPQEENQSHFLETLRYLRKPRAPSLDTGRRIVRADLADAPIKAFV